MIVAIVGAIAAVAAAAIAAGRAPALQPIPVRVRRPRRRVDPR